MPWPAVLMVMCSIVVCWSIIAITSDDIAYDTITGMISCGEPIISIAAMISYMRCHEHDTSAPGPPSLMLLLMLQVQVTVYEHRDQQSTHCMIQGPSGAVMHMMDDDDDDDEGWRCNHTRTYDTQHTPHMMQVHNKTQTTEWHIPRCCNERQVMMHHHHVSSLCIIVLWWLRYSKHS